MRREELLGTETCPTRSPWLLNLHHVTNGCHLLVFESVKGVRRGAARFDPELVPSAHTQVCLTLGEPFKTNKIIMVYCFSLIFFCFALIYVVGRTDEDDDEVPTCGADPWLLWSVLSTELKL